MIIKSAITATVAPISDNQFLVVSGSLICIFSIISKKSSFIKIYKNWTNKKVFRIMKNF